MSVALDYPAVTFRLGRQLRSLTITNCLTPLSLFTPRPTMIPMQVGDKFFNARYLVSAIPGEEGLRVTMRKGVDTILVGDEARDFTGQTRRLYEEWASRPGRSDGGAVSNEPTIGPTEDVTPPRAYREA